MNFEIFPRVVGDVLQSFQELNEDEEDISIIYENSDCYLKVYASDKYVAKVFENLDEGRSRCYTEYMNHMVAYSKLPQYMLRMHYFLLDNTSSCLIYERGYDLYDVEFEMNIKTIINIIQEFNAFNVFHLDTKISNFLIRSDGNIVIHDWGLACVTKQFDNVTMEKILQCQLRLLFILWSSEEPTELLELYDARPVFNLPEETMYTDEYFEFLFSVQDFHKFS